MPATYFAPNITKISGGTTAATGPTVVFSNSNNMTFGVNGNTVTASAGGAAAAQSLYALGNTTQNSSTTLSSLSFNALGAMTWGYSNGSIQVSAPVQSSLSATGNVSISTNGSTISIGARNETLSVWEPYPFLTSTNASSYQPASIWFDRVILPDPVAISYVNVIKSGSAAGPTASTASWAYSYKHGLTVYVRQDYGANSTNLTTYTTASIGISGSVNFNSVTQQSARISWVTDTTGGTTSFSTTSSNSAWVNFFTGLKVWRIPMVTTLPAGEYFFAHQHSSTTGTTNVNSTMLSFSVFGFAVAQSSVSLGTITSSGSIVSLHIGGQGFGYASATTSTTTMPMSVISISSNAHKWYMNFSNA